VPAFWVKLGANDLNCVDVPLNPTHSLTHMGFPEVQVARTVVCLSVVSGVSSIIYCLFINSA